MAKDPVVSNHKYTLFGIIVSNHARVEHGFRSTLGKMLHIPEEIALHVAAPYTTTHLRNVLYSVAKIVLHNEPKLRDQLIQIVGRQKALDAVRHDIAHNMWARGSIPGNIRAWRVDVREGKGAFSGFNKAAAEYNDQELEKLARDSVGLNKQMIAYWDSAVFAAAMAKKTDLASLDIDPILGISTSARSSPSSPTQP